MIKVERIERQKRENGRWWLVAYYSNGKDTVFGTTPTEAGSKRMLTMRAKQFGLTVNGDVAK